jgi:hypothetical protein
MGTRQYATEREDPNNWFRIPEFGVRPAEVGWQGFSHEILYPGCDRPDVRVDVRELVAILRRLAMREGASLRALAATMQDGDGTRADLERQRPTMRYVCIVRELERALEGRDADGQERSLESAFESLGRGSLMLAAWSEERATKNASKGAFARHAEHRSMKQQLFEWLDAHRAEYRTLDAAAIAAHQARLAPVTHGTIRRWATEWKKLRSARTR